MSPEQQKTQKQIKALELEIEHLTTMQSSIYDTANIPDGETLSGAISRLLAIKCIIDAHRPC